MKFTKSLAVLHGYLCSDGYVIRNPTTQKHKYYHIGFRNMNEVLLKDFQYNFENHFGIKPHITGEGRCRIQNKDIYHFLTKDFSYYSYGWKMPNLQRNHLKLWLRAFFDSEAWVENQVGKSRLIGLECCNENGIYSIQDSLKRLGIKSSVKKRAKRKIWRLTICGLENIKKFQKDINFLHPTKRVKLQKAIASYRISFWEIPLGKSDLLRFIRQKGRIRESRNQIQVLSVKVENLQNIQKGLKAHNISSNLLGPWKSNTCSQYYCLQMKQTQIQKHERETSSRSAETG